MTDAPSQPQPRRVARGLLLACCAGFLGVALGYHFGTRSSRPPAPGSEATLVARPGSAEAALDRILPEVDLEAVPFDEAIERLRRLTGAPLVVRRETLSAAQFDLKAPVSFRARNATLARALAELCQGVPLAQGSVVFGPVGDEILITTVVELTPQVVSVRAYDVQDLLAAAADDPWRNRPSLRPAPPAPPAADLIQLVQDTIAPDTWRQNGGPYGTICPFAGQLVVTQSWENHRQLANLLAQMREPEPPAPPAPVSPAVASAPALMLWDSRLGRYVSPDSTEGEAALRGRLAEVRLEALPFEQAVAALARLSHANLVPNWPSIESTGADRRMPVDLHLRDVTLADALRALLTVAGQNVLAFDPDGPYVLLSSREGAERPLLCSVYNVRDWITSSVGPPPAPASDRSAWQASKQAAVESLTGTIQSTIDPDSWKDHGGRFGSIQDINGQLVVTQTWENHQKVAALLAALRTGPATRPAGPGPESPPPAR